MIQHKYTGVKLQYKLFCTFLCFVWNLTHLPLQFKTFFYHSSHGMVSAGFLPIFIIDKTISSPNKFRQFVPHVRLVPSHIHVIIWGLGRLVFVEGDVYSP